MQGKRTPSCYEPVLLLDPEMDRATSLATQLELIGFPTRTESTGPAALAAIEDDYYASLIVAADLDDKACLDWLDDLRRASAQQRDEQDLCHRKSVSVKNAYHWREPKRKDRRRFI